MRKKLWMTAVLCACLSMTVSARELEQADGSAYAQESRQAEIGRRSALSNQPFGDGYTLYYYTDDAGIEISYLQRNNWAEKEMGELAIPDEIESQPVYRIKDAAFYGRSEFTGGLVLPAHLAEIGNKAFQDCSGLTGSLVLPEGLSAIGSNAFEGCSGLTGNLVLPEGLSAIGGNTFRGCSGFSNPVVLPKSMASVNVSAFCGWKNRVEFQLTEGMAKITMDGGSSSYKSYKVSVPKSVTEMDLPDCGFIYGYKGSSAEQYAEREGKAFIPLDGEPQIETYTVGTAEQLLEAIGSYRRIILKDGCYTLSDALDITGRVSLTLEAEHEGMAEILVDNSMVPVISVTRSLNVGVKGCILGHTSVTANECGGPESKAYVVSVVDSDQTRIEACDLYGCGLLGVYYDLVDGLSVNRCVIRDCLESVAKGVAWHEASSDVTFEECILRGNGKAGGYTAAIQGQDCTFKNCIFLNNYHFRLDYGDGSGWSFAHEAPVYEACRYYDNSWQEKTPKPYGICLNGITWAVEDDILKIGFPLAMEDGTVIESAKGKMLNYSEFSLPWRDYKNAIREVSVAEGVEYGTGGSTEPQPQPTQGPAADPDPVPDGYSGWHTADGREYWYEDGVKQGTEGRGKEVYDPESDAWYWLDAVSEGAKAVDKDVYQESSGGKWVRYDEQGRMVKGEDYRNGGWYYFEPVTGTMMKGAVTLGDGRKVFYDTNTGQMVKGEYTIQGQRYYFDESDGHLVEGDESNFWVNADGKDYWYEGWQRQGWNPADEGYRGKEVYDPASDAWYWLDNVNQGAKAVGKDVYQESYSAYPDREDGTGKWVRYDGDGHMVKGWQETEAGTYYFEEVTGAMAKGWVSIDGTDYHFDEVTGLRH